VSIRGWWGDGRAVLRAAGAYRDTLGAGSPQARLVLDDLARLCFAATTTFVPGDPVMTAFNEGKRSVFLHILEAAGVKPADLMAQQLEEKRE
jgi:hypothetical protein